MLRASQCLKVSIFLTDKHPELVTPRQQAGIYFFFQRDYHVGGAGAVTTTSALRSGRPGKRTGGCDRPRRPAGRGAGSDVRLAGPPAPRSEEHPSELQSLMRISYAVFCLKKQKPIGTYTICTQSTS